MSPPNNVQIRCQRVVIWNYEKSDDVLSYLRDIFGHLLLLAIIRSRLLTSLFIYSKASFLIITH